MRKTRNNNETDEKKTRMIVQDKYNKKHEDETEARARSEMKSSTDRKRRHRCKHEDYKSKVIEEVEKEIEMAEKEINLLARYGN